MLHFLKKLFKKKKPKPKHIELNHQPLVYTNRKEYTFEIDYHTSYGQNVYVTGNIAELGNWNIDKARRLFPVSFPKWQAKIIINVSILKNIEYKYFLKKEGSSEVIWLGDHNHYMRISK